MRLERPIGPTPPPAPGGVLGCLLLAGGAFAGCALLTFVVLELARKALS